MSILMQRKLRRNRIVSTAMQQDEVLSTVRELKALVAKFSAQMERILEEKTDKVDAIIGHKMQELAVMADDYVAQSSKFIDEIKRQENKADSVIEGKMQELERMAGEYVSQSTSFMNGIKQLENRVGAIIERKIAAANVKDGHTPTKEELIAIIEPLIPPALDGMPGRDADEERIVKMVLEKIKVPDSPEAEEIAKMALIFLEEKKIAIDDVKGLHDYLRSLSSKITLGSGGMRGGGDTLETISLSSQLNGTLKVFTLGSNKTANSVIALQGSQGPGIYEPLTHFTFTAPRTITLDASITAPSAGQVLLAICKMA